MNFDRLPNGCVDVSLTSFDILRNRAQQAGQLMIGHEGLSFLFLRACGVRDRQLMMILQHYDMSYPTNAQRHSDVTHDRTIAWQPLPRRFDLAVLSRPPSWQARPRQRRRLVVMPPASDLSEVALRPLLWDQRALLIKLALGSMTPGRRHGVRNTKSTPATTICVFHAEIVCVLHMDAPAWIYWRVFHMGVFLCFPHEFLRPPHS